MWSQIRRAEYDEEGREIMKILGKKNSSAESPTLLPKLFQAATLVIRMVRNLLVNNGLRTTQSFTSLNYLQTNSLDRKHRRPYINGGQTMLIKNIHFARRKITTKEGLCKHV